MRLLWVLRPRSESAWRGMTTKAATRSTLNTVSMRPRYAGQLALPSRPQCSWGLMRMALSMRLESLLRWARESLKETAWAGQSRGSIADGLPTLGSSPQTSQEANHWPSDGTGRQVRLLRGLPPWKIPCQCRLRRFGLGLGSSRVFFKPYPANHFTHCAADAMMQLRHDGLRPEDVASIRVGVASPTVRTIGEPLAGKRRPATGYQAQFSGRMWLQRR